jgi:ABC-2 type transport system ATP-binding protein
MSIIVKNLTKEYGLQKAVNDVSFTVNKGEIVGFIGPNGAGKSTTMKIITGFIREFSGSVEVNGLELSSNLIEVKRQIGYLPEHNPLYLDMYVREYLRFVAGIHKLGKESAQRINNVIELTGLGLEQKKKIGSLSKGYRQRVGLASTLVHDPAVLILDEATTGLDPNQIVEIRNLIANVGKEKTVLLSTHIMQEVEAICHKVIIINKGKIVMDDMSENVNSYSTTTQQIVFAEFSRPIDSAHLSSITGVIEVKNVEANKWVIIGNGVIDIRSLIFECAVQQSNQVLSLHEQHKSLEDVFREVTK